jgi:hypothetical protein
MEEVLKVLGEILEEMKFHSKQNDKIMELLRAQKKPCGSGAEKQILDLLAVMPPHVAQNPVFSKFFSQVKDVIKEQGK